ncbi:MAG: lipopolysaccharide assembly protein LapA domain-containing protein [Spirochaetaceae bacterium]
MRFLLGAILGALAVIFAVQNPEAVTYSLFAWSVSVPKALVIIITLVVGVFIGGFFTTGTRRKR